MFEKNVEATIPKLRRWLYTILINLNRNRLRSLARRPALSPLEDNDAPDELPLLDISQMRS